MTAGRADRVHVEFDGHRATVTLDAPHKRNALSAAVVRQLHSALTSAIEHPDIRVIVLTSVGTTFCAGADLSEHASAGDADDPRAARAGALFSALRHCPLPVIARVNGHARAAGVGLIGACDIAIGVDSATFAINEVRVGLLPATVAVPLSSRMSPRSLRRYALTGEVFDAAAAVNSGLLDACGNLELVDGLVNTLCGHFDGCEPNTLRRIKAYLDTLASTPTAQAEALSVSVSRQAFESPEAEEGRRAFRERRPPAWAN